MSAPETHLSRAVTVEDEGGALKVPSNIQILGIGLTAGMSHFKIDSSVGLHLGERQEGFDKPIPLTTKFSGLEEIDAINEAANALADAILTHANKMLQRGALKNISG
jgi:hypothetical protein